MGIEGAAIATVIAHGFTSLAFTILILRKRIRQQYGIWTQRRFDPELFRRFLRFGLPNGFQYLVDIAGFAAFILLIGKLGTEVMAATTLAFNLNTLAFLPLLGIGTAVSTLVGKRIGENRPQLAIRTTWGAFALGTAHVSVFVIVYIFFPSLILAPYGTYAETAAFESIRQMVEVLLRFVAVYCLFDTMAIVFGSAVRGAGDTRFSLLFGFACCWVIMVLPTFIVWNWYGGDLMVSWTACTMCIVVMGFGFLVRFQMGRWTTMRVIEDQVIADAVATAGADAA